MDFSQRIRYVHAHFLNQSRFQNNTLHRHSPCTSTNTCSSFCDMSNCLWTDVSARCTLFSIDIGLLIIDISLPDLTQDNKFMYVFTCDWHLASQSDSNHPYLSLFVINESAPMYFFFKSFTFNFPIQLSTTNQ
jgi:hypothetical protein